MLHQHGGPRFLREALHQKQKEIEQQKQAEFDALKARVDALVQIVELQTAAINAHTESIRLLTSGPATSLSSSG